MVLTPIVSLEKAKASLRVDSSDEDDLIRDYLASAEKIVMDAARLNAHEWEEIQKVTADDDGNVITIRSDEYPISEIIPMRNLLRAAILFTTTYLYEHREEANHHDLNMTVANMVYSIRQGVV